MINICPNCNHGIVEGTATQCSNCLYGWKVVRMQRIKYPQIKGEKET